MNCSIRMIKASFKHGHISLARFLVILQIPLASLMLFPFPIQTIYGNPLVTSGKDMEKQFEYLLTLRDKDFIEELENVTPDELRQLTNTLSSGILKHLRDLKHSDFETQLQHQVSKILKAGDPNEKLSLREFVNSLEKMGNKNRKAIAFINFLETEVGKKRRPTFEEKKITLFLMAYVNRKLDKYHIAHQQAMRLKAMLNDRQDAFYKATIALLNDIRSELTKAIKNIEETNFRNDLMDYAAVVFTLGDRKDVNELLTFLEYEIPFEKLKPEYRSDILYWKAECNYKLANYTSAYQQYVLLKLTVNDRGNPLLSELSTKFERARKAQSREYFSLQVRRLLSTIDIHNIYHKYFIYMLIFPPFFSSVTFLFLRWHKSFPSPKSKLLSWQTEILSSDTELIKEKEMLEQDYRVLFESNKKYFHLNKEGFEMIKEVNHYAPFPVAWIATAAAKIPYLKNLSYFWLFTIFGFVFVSTWGSFSAVYRYRQFQDWELSRPDFVFYFLIATLIISTLSAIRIISRKTIESLDKVLTVLEEGKSINELKRRLIYLFRSPWQFYISFILFGLTIALSKNRFSIHTIFVASLIIIFSSLLWLILKSLVTTCYLCTIRDLGINPLSPLKTLGLQKWISVIGTYAVSGSIVVTFAASISVVMGYIRGHFGMRDFFWLFIFIPFLTFYWIYPYRRLKALVKSQKMERMHFLKAKISQLFQDWVDAEKKLGQTKSQTENRRSTKKLLAQLDEINQYHNMFKEIDKSPESYIDISSALQLARVMGIPSLFALVSYYVSW